MRSLLRLIAILVLSVVACMALLVTVVEVTSTPPKQSKIVRDFAAHRAAYEQVRAMLLQDQGVGTVADWGIESPGSPIAHIPPEGGMTVARYREYLALLKQIGVTIVARRSEPLAVDFGVWGSGWGGDTRHVNVVWLEHEPPNTVESLDAFYRTPKPRTPSYVHIDGPWYLWADW